MTTIHVERTIAASSDQVFSWLAEPGNLTAAPLILKAGWAKHCSEPGVGAQRDATAVGMWLREEITAYDTHPASSGGKVLEALTSRLFPWNFRVILDCCARAVES